MAGTVTRFGIIGCGSAAVPVCEAIAHLPNTALARVHDINAELARDLGERYSVPYTTDLNKLLRDPELDALYIAVPHHLLSELAKQSLKANKHALVEKPLALTLQEMDELIALAEQKQRALGVFYEMRYADSFRQARALVRANVLGKIFGVKIQTLIDKKLAYWNVGYSGRSANPWRGEKKRAGGGVTLMNTSHLLDALWYITNFQITRIAAESGTLVANVEVEDTLAATLRFRNGAIGSLFAGAHIVGAHAAESFEIYGTQGTLRVPDPYSAEPLEIFLRTRWNDIPADTWHILPRASVNVFERAVQDFAHAVQHNARAPIHAYDARRVLQIVLALYRAAEEQRVLEIEIH
jgi:UDP-N-acetyl-2-amino-2-deoxyglucuronate dehydrogenase